MTPDLEETGAIELTTIAIYTGSVLGGIILILIIVMLYEKIRDKRKRVTEVVELKPIDLDAHFKGIEDRRNQKLSARKGP